MRRVMGLLGAIGCATGALAAQQHPPAGHQTPSNTLSAEERAQGFHLIFDGATTTGWRGFRRETIPDGWRVADGALTRLGGGGDIVTEDQYENFELRLQWKVQPGGNSGILFRVTEELERTYHSGPEMQVLDDQRHPDGRSRLTAAGSNYALHAVEAGIVRPAGEWNDAGIIMNGAHVEHWLNGVKTVEYELWTDEWEKLVRESKFVEWPGYGRTRAGHIALQDHGDEVAYRSIRIRILP